MRIVWVIGFGKSVFCINGVFMLYQVSARQLPLWLKSIVSQVGFQAWEDHNFLFFLVLNMGRHLERTLSGAQFEGSHPGCMWGIFHILDYHHWHYVKKILPHNKHSGGRHARCRFSPSLNHIYIYNGWCFLFSVCFTFFLHFKSPHISNA